MYYVVGRLIKDNKAVGFKCIYRDNTSKTKEVNLSNKSIDRLILNGSSIDIGKNRRGYYFKDRKRYISDLEKYDIDALYRERNKLSDIGSSKEARGKMIGVKGQQSKVTVKNMYTGRRLRKYIDTLSFQKEISKIEKLKRFLNTPGLYYGNCFIITGMKRTGKTILMEQGIRYLLNNGVQPKEILLIQYRSIDERVDSEIDSLIEYLTKSKCKYIFIDEVTMLGEFARHGRDFTDILCKNNNRRIVLSGSDTIAFTLAETEYIRNRCFKISTTVLEYKDWYNILKEDRHLDTGDTYKLMFEFMSDCTLNQYSQYISNIDMYNYLMDAISENIINSINKNTVYRSSEITESGLGDMDKEKVLFIFYVVCYDVIHKSISAKILSKKDIRINKGISTLTKSIVDKEIIQGNEEYIKYEILKRLGMSIEIRRRRPKINDKEYFAMLHIMREIGILALSGEYNEYNIDSERTEDEYVLAVPSIYSNFIRTIFTVCSGYYNGLADEVEINDMNDAFGLLFESVIVTQIKEYIWENARWMADTVGKLRIDNNKEIDILIPSNKAEDIKGCLYDVKISSKLNQRHFKAFDDTIKKRYSSIIKVGHAGIIYTGETVALKNGLVAINAHDFLMDIGKYIS